MNLSHLTPQQALAELKNREASSHILRKVVWRDKQPTLVECTNVYTKRFEAAGTPERTGRPATDRNDRIPSTWEAKAESARRQTFTIKESPVMRFSRSGNLPAEYYADEDAVEAYIATLGKDVPSNS